MPRSRRNSPAPTLLHRPHCKCHRCYPHTRRAPTCHRTATRCGHCHRRPATLRACGTPSGLPTGSGWGGRQTHTHGLCSNRHRSWVRPHGHAPTDQLVHPLLLLLAPMQQHRMVHRGHQRRAKEGMATLPIELSRGQAGDKVMLTLPQGLPQPLMAHGSSELSLSRGSGSHSFYNLGRFLAI